MMTRIKTTLARFKRDDCGASAVEFSIVAVLFVTASMAVMELGRTYQVRNELAFAADRGVRRLSVIVNTPTIASSSYVNEIKAEIDDVFLGYPGNTLSVTVQPYTSPDTGITYQELTLSYPMSVFIPFRGSTYNLEIKRRAIQL